MTSRAPDAPALLERLPPSHPATGRRVAIVCSALTAPFLMSHAQADLNPGGGQAASADVGARLAELVIPAQFGDGTAARLWDNTSSSEQAGASGIKFLGTSDQSVRLSVVEVEALREENQHAPPVRGAEPKHASEPRAALNFDQSRPLRWLQFNISQLQRSAASGGSTRLPAGGVMLCSRGDDDSCSPAHAKDEPLNEDRRTPGSFTALRPANADRMIEVNVEAQACQQQAETCSVRMASWRLARELASVTQPHGVGPAGLPDMLWVTPATGGTVLIYGARDLPAAAENLPWARIRFPDELADALGVSSEGTTRLLSVQVPAPFTLVFGFKGGFVSLNFAEDTCRAITAEGVWACRGGLASRAATAWLAGEAPQLTWELPLHLIQKVPSGQRNSTQSNRGAHPQPLALDANAAVFNHAIVQFSDPDAPGQVSWVDEVPLALSWPAPTSPGHFEGLPFAAFGLKTSGETTGTDGAPGQLAQLKPHKSRSGTGALTLLKGTLDGLAPHQIYPASSGVYALSTSGPLRYIGNSGVQNTSVQASEDIRFLGPRDLLVRRESGSGCQYAHMRAHPRFPASLSESGLSLPCGRTLRAALSPSGVTAAVLPKGSTSWIVRWLE